MCSQGHTPDIDTGAVKRNFCLKDLIWTVRLVSSGEKQDALC